MGFHDILIMVPSGCIPLSKGLTIHWLVLLRLHTFGFECIISTIIVLIDIKFNADVYGPQWMNLNDFWKSPDLLNKSQCKMIFGKREQLYEALLG